MAAVGPPLCRTSVRVSEETPPSPPASGGGAECVGASEHVLRRSSSRSWRKTVAFYTFIAPWLLGLVLLGIIPLVLGLLTSLTDYDRLNLTTVKFLGLHNYAQAFADPDARYSFGRTLLWAALNTPTWIVLSFVLALILHQDIKGRGLFRTLYYLPTITPVVATVWTWKIFLDRNYGLLNGVISLFRPGTAIPWLAGYALPSLTAISIWGGLGWGMVVFLAGLQDIPDELVEAARIDGATSWQVFRHVTIPLMTPVIFFVLVNGLISAFQQLTIPLLMAPKSTGSGYTPPRPIYLYIVHTYREIFTYQQFGYGTAMLWLLTIVIVAFTLLIFRTSRYWVYYEVAAEEQRQ